MTRPAATLFRFWLAATGFVLVAIAVWAFAPVVLFLILLTGALGALSALMIRIARGLQAWRARRDP